MLPTTKNEAIRFNQLLWICTSWTPFEPLAIISNLLESSNSVDHLCLLLDIISPLIHWPDPNCPRMGEWRPWLDRRWEIHTRCPTVLGPTAKLHCSDSRLNQLHPGVWNTVDIGRRNRLSNSSKPSTIRCRRRFKIVIYCHRNPAQMSSTFSTMTSNVIKSSISA